MIITLCASMSFYQHCIDVADELSSMGLTVLVPEAALNMKKDHSYDVKKYVEKYYNNNLLNGKPDAMRTHFHKIAQADAILVVNDEKHNTAGYIGPNVLMEMGLAFYLEKTIFVLHEIPLTSPFTEELQSMKKIPLYGNLSSIKSYVK